MTNLSKSTDRYTFHLKCTQEKVATGKADEDELQQVIDMYNDTLNFAMNRESSPEWAKDNMEYDLRTTDWILEKVRTSDIYAQNLYAAMCNNDFAKVEIEDTPEKIVEILSRDNSEHWSCSWRHAGGIISDMRQEGDYIDWYCSGIKSTPSDEEYNNAGDELKQRYDIYAKYVAESVVTDEIREDLLKLGWKVIEE